MKDKLTLATKLLLDFMFYTGILVTLTLPISIKFYGRYNSYFANNYVPLILLFFFSGTFAILTTTVLSWKMSQASGAWALIAW